MLRVRKRTDVKAPARVLTFVKDGMSRSAGVGGCERPRVVLFGVFVNLKQSECIPRGIKKIALPASPGNSKLLHRHVPAVS